MPNFEIHGFFGTPGNVVQDVYSAGNVRAIRLKINEAMKKLGLEKDAIVTVIPSMALSCDGDDTPMPYLRICNTNTEETYQIIEALRDVGIDELDVETMTLSSFILATEMKK